jgi:hypothetical protein
VNYWKVIVATAVIFGAGVFTGGLLVNYVHQSYARNNPAHRSASASGSNSVAATTGAVRFPEVLSKPFLPKLDDLLHLSSEQHKAIERIITEAQGQMRKVAQDTRLAIRTELTPDQRARFDEVMKHPAKRPAGGTNAMESLLSGNQPKLDASPTNAPVDVPTNLPATTN